MEGFLQKNAASIILAHDHLSGDPEPSHEDIKLIGRLMQAGGLMGVRGA
ncbi:MAG: hypothetical protein HYX90_02840 [Chloroflexi bacterium]|nr:hypothetical protein [Chloroflexota bacterium]